MEYFCDGAADSFESVQLRAAEAAGPGAHDQSSHLRRLEPRQHRVLELFHASETINNRDVEKLFGLSQRIARGLLTAWVESGLLVVADPAKKTRKYGLVRELRNNGSR